MKIKGLILFSSLSLAMSSLALSLELPFQNAEGESQTLKFRGKWQGLGSEAKHAWESTLTYLRQDQNILLREDLILRAENGQTETMTSEMTWKLLGQGFFDIYVNQQKVGSGSCVATSCQYHMMVGSNLLSEVYAKSVHGYRRMGSMINTSQTEQADSPSRVSWGALGYYQRPKN